MLVVHLFVSYAHVNLCHFFSSSWCQGLAATSACGSSWIFLWLFCAYLNRFSTYGVMLILEFFPLQLTIEQKKE